MKPCLYKIGRFTLLKNIVNFANNNIKNYFYFYRSSSVQLFAVMETTTKPQAPWIILQTQN